MSENKGKRKTTIVLPYETWRRLKIYAAMYNKDMSEVIDEALREYFEKRGFNLT